MKRMYREPSESTKQKMSLKKAGAANPNWQKATSDEVKKKISDALKKYWETIPSRHERSDKEEVQHEEA